MKRKIKITESQYNKLQEYLFESNVNDTLDYANVGDVLLFKGPYNVKINVNGVDQGSGEILGSTDKGDKVKFSFNSYDDQTGKFDFNKLDTTTNKYVNTPFDVKDLEILRNGKPLQIPDLNKERPKPTPKQPVPQDDEAPKTVELDPNSKPTEEDKVKARKILAKLTKPDDPIVQSLQFKQAGWLEHISAELVGRKARHGGITAAFDLLGNYIRNYVERNFQGFHEGGMAEFILLNDVDIHYTTGNFTMDANSRYFAKVENLAWDSNSYILTNKEDEFQIRLKGKTLKPDVFNCTVTKLYGQRPEKVQVQFLDSEGYTIVANQEKK